MTTGADLGTLGRARVDIVADFSGLDREFGRNAVQAEKRAKGLGAKIGQAISFAAVTAFAKSAVQTFASFEKNLSLISTLSDEAAAAQPRLARAIREMSKESGQNLDNLAKAGFDMISATGDVVHSTDGLRAAWRLATAGGTDVAIATDGITSALNAYSLSVGDAEKVSQALFKAQQFGKTTVEQLSREVGTIAPAARAAGVSMEEMFGVLGAATRVLRSNIAATSLRAFFSAINTASDEQIALSKKMAKEAGVVGFEFSRQQLATSGLTRFLKDLGRVVGDDARKLQDLGVAVEAQQGVQVLLRDGVKDATEAIAKQRDGIDELEKGVKRVSGTTAHELAKMEANWRSLSVTIGEEISKSVGFVAGGGFGDLARLLTDKAGLTTHGSDRREFGQLDKKVAQVKEVKKLLTDVYMLQGRGGGDFYGLTKAAGLLASVRDNDDRSGPSLAENEKRLAEARRLIAEQAAIFDRIEAASRARHADGPATAPGAASTPRGATDGEREKVEAARQALFELVDMRRDMEHEVTKIGQSETGKQLADMAYRYERLREEFAGNEFALTEIARAESAERSAIIGQADEGLLDEHREFQAERKRLADEAVAQLAALDMNSTDAAIAQTNREFDELVRLAKLRGEEIVEIERERAATIATIRKQADPGLAGGFTGEIERMGEEFHNLGRIGAKVATGLHSGLSDAITSFATGAKSASQAFGDFARSFLTQIVSMIAQAAVLALLQSIISFGTSAETGGASFAAALSAGLGALSGLPRAEHGGSFRVGGTGGIDSQVVGVRATPGEVVSVQTPQQARSGGGMAGKLRIEVLNLEGQSSTSTLRRGPNGDELKILITRTVAQDIKNGGEIDRTMRAVHGTQRRGRGLT